MTLDASSSSSLDQAFPPVRRSSRTGTGGGGGGGILGQSNRNVTVDDDGPLEVATASSASTVRTPRDPKEPFDASTWSGSREHRRRSGGFREGTEGSEPRREVSSSQGRVHHSRPAMNRIDHFSEGRHQHGQDQGKRQGQEQTDIVSESGHGDLSSRVYSRLDDQGEGVITSGGSQDRGKWKGKAKVDHNQSDRQGDRHEEEDEVDPEIEERRIRENLAKWSQADRKRRASIRRQSQFVTPTINLPNPPPVPSASALIRRTSTMVRKRTMGRGLSSSSRGAQEEENPEVRGGKGVIELRSSTGSSSRKELRKHSVVLERGRDGFVSPDSALGIPLVREGEEDESPPVSPRLASEVTSQMVPTRTSTSTNDSRTSGSRFIEDLPLPSPTRLTNQNPFSSPPAQLPNTPTKNPFSDSTTTVDLDATPTANSRKVMSGRGESMESLRSISSSNDTATIGDTERRTSRDEHDPRDALAPQSKAEPLSEQYHDHFAAPTLYQHEPLPTSPPLVVPPYKNPNRIDRELQNEEVQHTVGLLDWLLCGCWRPRGWDSNLRDGQQQQGRTNPME